MTRSVRLLAGWLAVPSVVCIIKQWEVTLPSSYRGTCSFHRSQNYDICFRRERGYCSICFTPQIYNQVSLWLFLKDVKHLFIWQLILYYLFFGMICSCTGCSLNIFFPRILDSLPPLPYRHSAAIGCTKNYKPLGVTVHSHCVDSFKGLLQQCKRGRGCSGLGRGTVFPEHPVVK